MIRSQKEEKTTGRVIAEKKPEGKETERPSDIVFWANYDPRFWYTVCSSANTLSRGRTHADSVRASPLYTMPGRGRGRCSSLCKNEAVFRRDEGAEAATAPSSKNSRGIPERSSSPYPPPVLIISHLLLWSCLLFKASRLPRPRGARSSCAACSCSWSGAPGSSGRPSGRPPGRSRSA